MSTRAPLERIDCPECPELTYGTYKGYEAIVCSETETPHIVLWESQSELSLRSQQSPVAATPAPTERSSTTSPTNNDP
ncbi:hypothetical protein G6M89_15125 [Natronolimnobius sp. AArcel1]|uniref:hypothetical protein n=1 Tax=Natronolimnobius sp. AArcel1 TaxID=1679093 RepID=UPI0013E9A60E|nr:hypothetical protein [Natronolimnobius sp. AArcel1]NGM70325.1 hypothetical protein [Natronolimnobius sp. AArcel1]